MEFDVPCKLCDKLITEENQEATGSSGIITAAEMLNSQCFLYGLSGVFSIKNYRKLDLKEKDEICNICLSIIKFDEFKNVCCGVCHNYFQAIFDLSGKNGFDCASSVKDKVISCGYGSRHDGDQFDTDLKDMVSICDDCIEKLESGE